MPCKLTDCKCALEGKPNIERLSCDNYIVPVSKTDTGYNIIGERKRKTIKIVVKPSPEEMKKQKEIAKKMRKLTGKK